MKRIKLHNKEFEEFISEDQIRSKVKELALQIEDRFRDKNPLFLCILNGSFIFAADLLRYIQFDTEVQFVKLSSYQGLSSTGKVKESIWNKDLVKGRDLIIIEDIIDTGETLHYFIPQVNELGPISVNIVSFLVKPDAMKYPLDIQFSGIEIPNQFVVGYGLDYDELGRNLESIYKLVE